MSADFPVPNTDDVSPGSVDGPPKRRLPYRIVASGAIFFTLAGMAIVDRTISKKRAVQTAALVDSGPVATADTARSSTWFCVGGADAVGAKASTVIVANPTDQRRTGSIRILSAQGTIATTPITLNPGERRDVLLPVPPEPPASDRSSTPTETPATDGGELEAPQELGPDSERGIAAIVEFDGGGVVAEHRVSDSVAPCSAAASPTWYLPDGATTRDATTSITLVNPFADDAIVDVLVATNTSSARPSALQGVFVPAGTVRTVDLDRFVRRRSYLSATVTSRTGRIVTEGFLKFDGSGTIRGSTIVSASPSRGSAWYFPSGKASSVLRERYFLTNPGDTDLTVELAFLAADREEPFELDIPARSILEFDTANEERVPKGVDYSVVVSSTSNRTFLASRRLQARSTLRSGLSSTLGARVQSNRWTIADASADAQIDDRIAIVNPTEDPTLISVFQIGAPNSVAGDWTPIEGAQDIAMTGGSRLDIRIGDFVAVSGGSFAVLSDGAPVIVDRTRVLVRERGGRPRRPVLAASIPEDAPATLETAPANDAIPAAGAASPIGGRGFAVSGGPTGSTVSTGSTTTTRVLSTTPTTPTTPTTRTTSTTPTTTLASVASLLRPITSTSGVGASTTTTASGTIPASSTTAAPTITTAASTSLTTTTAASTSTTITTAATTATTITTAETTTNASTTTAASTTTTPATSTAVASTKKPSATPAARVAVAVVVRARIGTSTAMAVASAGA
jgi:hypothetical protein